jgi:hypothetical protein
MNRKPEKGDEGYALRAGKFMRGARVLQVDPEIVERCLSASLSASGLRVPVPAALRILRIATFIGALRKLRNRHKRRSPHGNE